MFFVGERVYRRRQHDVAFDRQQFARLRQPLECLAQIFADHAADVGGVRHHVIESLILGEPLYRGLRAALGHTGHVVHGVADQRQIINNTFGRHAEFFLYAGDIECFIGHRVDQRDLRIDELRNILVTGRNDGAHAALACGDGERANHVVGLDAVYHQ